MNGEAPCPARDLPISLRAALDLIATGGGSRRGVIRARIIGRPQLAEELAGYAPIADDGTTLIALDASQEEVRAAVIAASPARVLTLTAGALARPLSPVLARGAAWMPDLDGETWRTLGYERADGRGVQGVAALGWAIAERVLRQLGRPDLADRSRIAMQRTMVTTRRTAALATALVTVYRRSG